MSKKLLQINVTASWGSTGKIAEQIGLVAMQHGWESYIAYGRMMNPSKSTLIKIGNQWDVYRHYLEGRYLDNEGLASRKPTAAFLKTIEDIKPDITHLHNIHDHYLNYPLLFEYLAEKRIPVVWTQHDLWAATGGCCYIPDECEKWKAQCERCILRNGIALDQSKRNYDLKKKLFNSLESLTVVPVSDWLGGMIKESFLQNCRIRVIHNGIDTNLFKPQVTDVHQKYGMEGKKIVLGVASEWSRRKGLEDLLELAKLLPENEYGIIIVGKILDDTHTEILCGCSVVYIDRTQNALELAALYSAASVFVNPTYQDNYPTTNLEAMACGTPVITYDTGGSPEAVTPETGWVVEQGNVKGIASIVKSLEVKDKSEIVAKRVACRKRAMEYYDKNDRYREYVELYEELIKRKEIEPIVI